MKPEKTLIVYFSQTGNTKKVCDAIQKGIQANGADCDVVTLEEVAPEMFLDYSLIGIGTPVFYYKEPFTITELIRSMPPMQGKKAFLFVTTGGHPTNIFLRMTNLLKQKGLSVIDIFQAFGYDTYPPFIGKDRQLGHPDAEELAAAETFGRGLLEKFQKVESGDTSILPTFKKKRGKFNRLSVILKKPVLKAVFPKKNLNKEKCTECGVCAERCPVDNIQMNPAPEFGKKCIYCYLCQRVCTTEAIECDWSFISKFISE